MEYKLNDMCDWERKKAIFLMSVAEDLGMDLSQYGEIAVNPNSGYTYLWLEDYNFTLYMPINCELQKSDIYTLWNCSYCGTEEETELQEKDSIEDIQERINELEKEHLKQSEKCNE